MCKIQKLRTRKPRYKIYFDTGASCEVSAWTIGNFGVRRGDELSEKEVETMQTFDAQNTAKEYALNFLSYRPRSSAEVRSYLIRKGYPESLADDVVEDLKKLNMINDLSFARMFLTDQIRKKPQGPQLLRQRLLAKGIDQRTIETLLQEFVSDNEQLRAATTLLGKKFPSHLRNKKCTPKEYQRMSAFLYRRGFSPDIIHKVLHTSIHSSLQYDTE